MRTSSLMAIAAICGLAAFAWSLIAGAPDPVRGLGRGAALVISGTQDPAAIERFLADNPDAYQSWFELAQRLRNAGDAPGAAKAWKTAADVADRLAPQHPNDAQLYFVLARAREEIGDEPGARSAYTKAAALFESINPGRMSAMTSRNLGWCRFKTGDAKAAHLAWARAAELQNLGGDRPDNPGWLYNLACFRALAGDRDLALATLERSALNGWRDRPWAEHDEDFDFIRDDPRFAAALDAMTQPVVEIPPAREPPPEIAPDPD